MAGCYGGTRKLIYKPNLTVLKKILAQKALLHYLSALTIAPKKFTITLILFSTFMCLEWLIWGMSQRFTSATDLI